METAKFEKRKNLIGRKGVMLAWFLRNRVNVPVGRFKHILPDKLGHSERWIYVTAVYADGVYPVSP